MKNDPQPPINPTDLLRNRIGVDYEYDDAKDAGCIHRPLVGGGWVTHYEWKVEYAKGRMEVEATPYRRRQLNKALARLYLIRLGHRLETHYQWQNNSYRWHQIGVNDERE